MKDEAWKLALEVLQINLTLLKKINPYKGQEDLLSDSLNLTHEAIKAIKQSRALDKMAENARELGLDYEPVQEPIGEVRNSRAYFYGGIYTDKTDAPDGTKIYNTPPAAQRQWVGLTKEDRVMYAELYGSYEAVLAIEAKLKELNT
jgi:hypothetical protein